MRRSRHWKWLVVLLAVVAAGFASQDRPKIPDPEIVRGWVEDDAGYRVWKPLEGRCLDCKGVKQHECRNCTGADFPQCLECGGEKKAPCRTCAGTGNPHDPLVDVQCAYCWGAAYYRCGLCNGWGFLKVDDVEVKCKSCDEQGLLPCEACEGERFVPVVKLGSKGPGHAKVKDLLKVKETLTVGLEELRAWEPNQSQSKNQKALGKLLKKPARALPLVKGMLGMLETVLKNLRHGAGLKSYEANVTHQFLVFKDRTEYLLKHQILLVDLCLAHAEHNERVKAADR